MHWKQSTPNIFHEAAQGAEKKKIVDEKKRLNCAHSKRYSKWKTKNPQTSAYFCSSVFIDCDKNHFAMDYCLTSISYYESELMRFTKELKSNHQFRCEKEELRVKKSYQVSLLRSIISISFSQIHTHTLFHRQNNNDYSGTETMGKNLNKNEIKCSNIALSLVSKMQKNFAHIPRLSRDHVLQFFKQKFKCFSLLSCVIVRL